MKRKSILKTLISVPILVLLVAPVCFFFVRMTSYIDVRNLSGQTITDVVLQLRDHQTDWTIAKRAARLKPGERIRIRHAHNDTKAVVEFAVAGQRFRHEEGYIDLWRGEGWRFDVRPGGTVQSDYDYDRETK